MMRWVALSMGVVMAYGLVHSWPEIQRYMRIRAM
jgi:hypothetical protein